MIIKLDYFTTTTVQVNLYETEESLPHTCMYYNTPDGIEQLKEDIKDFPKELAEILDKWKDDQYVIEKPDFPELSEEELKKIDQESMLNYYIQNKLREDTLASLTDEQAAEIPLMYPEWESFSEDYEFKKDERVCYDGELYKCLQYHTKQADLASTKTLQVNTVSTQSISTTPKKTIPGTENGYWELI